MKKKGTTGLKKKKKDGKINIQYNALINIDITILALLPDQVSCLLMVANTNTNGTFQVCKFNLPLCLIGTT